MMKNIKKYIQKRFLAEAVQLGYTINTVIQCFGLFYYMACKLDILVIPITKCFLQFNFPGLFADKLS